MLMSLYLLFCFEFYNITNLQSWLNQIVNIADMYIDISN
ncbi:hypothetical protein LA55_460 [Francisella philomiragia]|uniref:Uncharacterized protein n=1 Tax=Francisella philomiragia TaxID=28110 RepID=A0A0B6CS66_9GAMM|nr:hypothetical protein LA55_460 [Francisella philomiragia]